MPVTAKFSEEFYEKLGHGIVNEFVDWFNHMDLAYKTELRELNEVNFQRFEAVLRGEISGVGREISGVESRLEKKISGLAQEISGVESRLNAKIDSNMSSLRVEISELGGEMVAMKTEIIKWMFLFWSGTALTVIGVMVALTR